MVFKIPLKLKLFGSSKLVSSGVGVSICAAPDSAKYKPKFPSATVKALAPTVPETKPPVVNTGAAPGRKMAAPIRTAPNKNLPRPLLAPTATGTIYISC